MHGCMKFSSWPASNSGHLAKGGRAEMCSCLFSKYDLEPVGTYMLDIRPYAIY